MIARLSEWPPHTLTILPAIFIVNLGMWAARMEILEDAPRYKRWLRLTAGLALSIAWLGALPHAFASAGVLQPDERTALLMNILHKVSGMFGGPGYIALLALLSMSLQSAMPRATRIIAALGRRSLSGYLLQSFAWLMLFAPYTLALGYYFESSFIASLIAALAVWSLTLALAAVCEHYGYRGPAEVLLRRLTYGSQTYRRATA
jgi:uncharacterized protein